MKCLLLILVLQNVIECESSDDFKEKMTSLFWKSQTINIRKYPFKSLLFYYDIRNDFKNLIDLKFPELLCNIKDICTVCKIDAETKYDFQWFCKLYNDFEHKSKFVFYISNLNFWFLYSQNIIIHSEQFVNNAGNIFLNTR